MQSPNVPPFAWTSAVFNSLTSTLTITFSQPLYPGFWPGGGFEVSDGFNLWAGAGVTQIGHTATIAMFLDGPTVDEPYWAANLLQPNQLAGPGGSLGPGVYHPVSVT